MIGYKAFDIDNA